MARDSKNQIVGLDIGTSKILAVVCEVLPGSELKLIGLGDAKSEGIKRGIVVDIDATVVSIQNALHEAELMADCKISHVYVGLTGKHLRGETSSGMVVVRHNDEVTEADVQRAVETSTAISIAGDRRVLLIEPQEFRLNEEPVRVPVGMIGKRLEVLTYIVSGAKGAAENLAKCVRRSGLKEEDAVPLLNPVASSSAVLTDDERELGVACLDIGAGTTDIAVYRGGTIRYIVALPIAGELITADIAHALQISTADAENIKIEHGCARELHVDAQVQIEVPAVGGRNPRMLSKQALAAVIQPRVEEIFRLVRDAIPENDLTLLTSGFVLTGGTAEMPEIVELAEDIFQRPVRRGVPHYSRTLADMVSKPRAATVMGLLEIGRRERADDKRVALEKGRMKTSLEWLRDFFVGNF